MSSISDVREIVETPTSLVPPRDLVAEATEQARIRNIEVRKREKELNEYLLETKMANVWLRVLEGIK